MNKIWKRILSTALVLVTLMTGVSCTGAGDEAGVTEATSVSTTEETTTKAPDTNVTEVGEDKLRVLITSDVHYTTLKTWYGIPARTRMQWWVDAIKKEHEMSPLDLIIIAGDTSLDHYSDKGTYTTAQVSETKVFVDQFVSQLPEEIPVFILPGNHEQYSNEQWREITGNDRRGAIAIKGNLFVMPDNYNDNLEPNRKGDPAYTPTDVDFVKEQMDAHPECDKVWLVAHMFDPKLESDAFKKLVKEDKRIMGLFAGHTHQCSAIKLGAEFGGKRIAQTGNYSYTYYTTSYVPSIVMEDVKNSFWGFRDLTITDEAAISNYIIADTKSAVVNGQTISLKRRTTDSVRYY